MLPPDTVLQNRYRIVRQLGVGGMGTVYEAIDLRFDNQVALKETHFTNEALRKQFEREARLLNKLRHPALARVIDHFTEGDGQHLVMDFIEGDDLFEMLRARGSAFPVEEGLKWADQLLDALDYLHSHEPPIIHRDIKPQNLKLTGRNQIILLDFGLAKGFVGQISRVTTSGSIFGYTPNYAPLEQIHGTGTDARSDLYSLAATLYHLLTNTIPPDALSRAMAITSEQPDPLRPANEVNPQVSADVAEVMQRAMATNPAKRPDTAAEMREILQKANIQAPTDNQIDLPSTIILPAPTKASQEQSIESSLSKTQALQLEYWTAFRDRLQQRNSFLKPSKPQAQTWFPLAIGRSHFRLEASTQRKDRRVCAYLILSGPDAKPHFHLLQRDKEAIEHEIGESLEWSERSTREQCYVFLCKHKTDPENRQDWEAQHEWLKEKLELFHRVFAPKIKMLDASDDVPEGVTEANSQQVSPAIASPTIVSPSPLPPAPLSPRSSDPIPPILTSPKIESAEALSARHQAPFYAYILAVVIGILAFIFETYIVDGFYLKLTDIWTVNEMRYRVNETVAFLSAWLAAYLIIFLVYGSAGFLFGNRWPNVRWKWGIWLGAIPFLLSLTQFTLYVAFFYFSLVPALGWPFDNLIRDLLHVMYIFSPPGVHELTIIFQCAEAISMPIAASIGSIIVIKQKS